MFREIERKFVIQEFPHTKEILRATIKQSYLSVKPEVRIRSKHFVNGNSNYVLTVKGSGTLSRFEINIHIFRVIYNFLYLFVKVKSPIIKDYRVYALSRRKFECSVVDKGTANEFMYGEIEFITEEEASSFETPEGYIDVTNDPKYKMKNYWERTRLSSN